MHKVRKYLALILAPFVLSTIGALLITLRYLIRTPQPLTSVLSGNACIYKWTHGRIFYKVAGAVHAPPLVLLHSPEIGSSSYEMRHLIDKLSLHYRVYAPDLLGFGLSDRPDIAYSPHIYVTLVRDFLKDIIGQPALLVASGLSCNYAVALAATEPELCERIVLLSPFMRQGEQKPSPWLHTLLQQPVIGMILYANLVSGLLLPGVVAKQQRLHYDQIPTTELDYISACAHQRGAQYAAKAYIAGELDLDVSTQYAVLKQPVLIFLGGQKYTDSQIVARQLRAPALAEIEDLYNIGLHMQEEHPTRIAAKILAWSQPQELAQPNTLQLETARVLEPLLTKQPVRNVTTEIVEGVHAELIEPQENVATTQSSEAYEAYCVKCRQKRHMLNAKKIVTKNGRSAMEGLCPVCNTRLFRFVAS